MAAVFNKLGVIYARLICFNRNSFVLCCMWISTPNIIYAFLIYYDNNDRVFEFFMVGKITCSEVHVIIRHEKYLPSLADIRSLFVLQI